MINVSKCRLRSQFFANDLMLRNSKLWRRQGSLNSTQRWDFLNKKCEEFHNLEHQFQIDPLINFLSQCASRIPEPTEELEVDPQDNEKDISDE